MKSLSLCVLFLVTVTRSAADAEPVARPEPHVRRPRSESASPSAPPSPPPGGRPRSPGTRGAALNAMQARLQRWATSRQARHLANVANSALLLLTFPASLRGGLLSGLALHRLLTSAWVSGFGGMLLMRELSIPPVRRWLNQHFHFLSTTSGSTAFLM